MKKCIIFTGGVPITPSGFEVTQFNNSYIVAADSGCNQIELLNKNGIKIIPDLLLGDMDSFDKSLAIQKYSNTEFMNFPPEKDYTDTQLAYEIAKERGFNNITIVGGTGNRADHFLANLSLFRKSRKDSIELSQHDGKNIIRYCGSEKILLKADKRYKYFSIIPDGSNLFGVSVSGAKYPLNDAEIDEYFPITVSNEITENICEITVTKGNFFLILSSD